MRFVECDGSLFLYHHLRCSNETKECLNAESGTLIHTGFTTIVVAVLLGKPGHEYLAILYRFCIGDERTTMATDSPAISPKSRTPSTRGSKQESTRRSSLEASEDQTTRISKDELSPSSQPLDRSAMGSRSKSKGPQIPIVSSSPIASLEHQPRDVWVPPDCSPDISLEEQNEIDDTLKYSYNQLLKLSSILSEDKVPTTVERRPIQALGVHTESVHNTTFSDTSTTAVCTDDRYRIPTAIAVAVLSEIVATKTKELLSGVQSTVYPLLAENKALKRQIEELKLLLKKDQSPMRDNPQDKVHETMERLFWELCVTDYLLMGLVQRLHSEEKSQRSSYQTHPTEDTPTIDRIPEYVRLVDQFTAIAVKAMEVSKRSENQQHKGLARFYSGLSAIFAGRCEKAERLIDSVVRSGKLDGTSEKELANYILRQGVDVYTAKRIIKDLPEKVKEDSTRRDRIRVGLERAGVNTPVRVSPVTGKPAKVFKAGVPEGLGIEIPVKHGFHPPTRTVHSPKQQPASSSMRTIDAQQSQTAQARLTLPNRSAQTHQANISSLIDTHSSRSRKGMGPRVRSTTVNGPLTTLTSRESCTVSQASQHERQEEAVAQLREEASLKLALALESRGNKPRGVLIRRQV
jgi:hypothetical protein